jgi:soluble lytic murein transglycosylase
VVYTALSRCGSRLSDDQRSHIAAVIVDESNRHGYDPLFVQAIVEVESTCRPAARSQAGAVGLIQVKPSTARAVAERNGMNWEGSGALTRPAFNVQVGLQYLAQLEERFQDSYLAVAAYNLGPTRVADMPRQRARDTKYVRKVMSRYESLLARRAGAAS